ncbi:hypothetical protein BN424_1511 [Carnobacterium maltaromaticum LMA28]|uniref:Uncharacterized protein n=1 Tax=Carnobacterium maltaromaticum LMA28 TaxID=1234679 RepID=K8E3N6_CARML|nr:hypothetical protein BN424_1511 [Carnobacterium maltaromaticum LMA28]
MAKNATSNFPIFLPGLIGSTNFLSRLVLMSQSFEKKMKFRDGKERHIEFPYFLIRPNRLNKLFIKASSYEPTLRKEDKIPSK